MFADLIRPFALIAKTRFHSLKDAWTILEVMSLMSTIWNMSLFTNFSMSLNFRWFRCKSCSSGRKPSLSSEEDIYVPKDPFKKRCLRSVFIFVYFLLAVVAIVVTYAMVQVCTCSIISIQDCVLVSSYHWSFAEKTFVKQSMILECAQKLCLKQSVLV